MKKLYLLTAIFFALLSLSACSSNIIKAKSDNSKPIYEETISPNKDYAENENDKVIYIVQIYQNSNNKITVKASSNSAFFDEVQYEAEIDKKISASDISIVWTTLMGNTQPNEYDQLAVADISISSDGKIISERKINFCNNAIEIIVDNINQNS